MESGGIDPDTVAYMDRSTVKVRFIDDKLKLKKYTTGFFIGKIGRLAIIFTVAHFVESVPNIEYSDKDELEIVCFGSDEAYPCRIELLIPESEILILSCFTDKEIEHFFEFAPKEEWEKGIKGQKIFSTSHPIKREYRMVEGIVASSTYFNQKTIPRYDPKMMFFDHNMSMGAGSSGAGILNTNKNVVGLQSGELSATQNVMSAGPWEKVYNSMKTGNKQKDENLAVSGSSLSIKIQDIGIVKTCPSNMNYAVHIAYLDAVLRKHLSYLIEKDDKTVSLNSLVLDYVYQNNYSEVDFQ